MLFYKDGGKSSNYRDSFKRESLNLVNINGQVVRQKQTFHKILSYYDNLRYFPKEY